LSRDQQQTLCLYCHDTTSTSLLPLPLAIKNQVLLFQAKDRSSQKTQPDEPISFLALSGRSAKELGGENVFELSLNQAVGGGRQTLETTTGSSRLNKVTQLTGFSDPVYAEAYVHVNQYDIVLDVLVVNQTGKSFFLVLNLMM